MLENLSWARRARLAAILVFVALIYGWKFWRLQHSLKPREWFLTRDDQRALRLRRRFNAGAAAGFVASADTLSQPLWSRVNFIYADISALWSNFLIAADATTDVEGVSLDEVRDLFGDAFAAMFLPVTAKLAADDRRSFEVRFVAMFGKEIASPGPLQIGPRYRLQRYTLYVATAIGDRIANLTVLNPTTPFGRALGQFYTRLLDLMAGQLQTYEQTTLDEVHDWGWYRQLMHNKFMNVLLAPIALFADPAAGRYPEPAMRKAFHLLNRNFHHRQVLDDLLDFDEDLANNTANTLTYILVTQGRIASGIAGRDLYEDQPDVLRELDRSGLLAHPAAGFDEEEDVVSDRDPAPSLQPPIDALVRKALANRPGDASVSLPELIDASRCRGAALLEAWARRDQAAVAAIVTKSGVANRILDSISAGVHQREIEDALKAVLERDSIHGCIYVYYLRTLRTYRKCVSKWRSNL